jgi:protein-tyrosine-phosphatase
VSSGPSFAVLFVCTFNRVRSPMAAGLMRLIHGDAAAVDSCGLEPGAEVDGFAAAIMAEVGVDLFDHTPQRLEDLIAQGRFTHIVTLSEEARVDFERRDGHAAAVVHWAIDDPAQIEGARDSRLDAYRLTRQQLERRILERFGAPRTALAGRL